MQGKERQRSARAAVIATAIIVAGVVVAIIVWRAVTTSGYPYQDLYPLHDDSSPIALDQESESRIVAFCSDCHGMPPPESFPRNAWHREVKIGYRTYAQSGRTDLDPPPMHQVITYFRSRAPERLVFPEPKEAETDLSVQFVVENLTVDRNSDLPMAVAHLLWARLEPNDRPVLLACDMRNGNVGAVDLGRRSPSFQPLARLSNPCHAEVCDLDGDDATDLVVADLGSFFAGDHDLGRVVWLRRQELLDSYQEIVIATGFGRVADVQPADFDGDGRLDLIVADFGWRDTGQIVLLRQVDVPGELPRFEPERLDPRPGAIHVPVHDFNEDGWPDFVALVSQEYECVELFLNQPDAKFNYQTLWAAPDLTFGSTGIELVDLDQDGDLDVLYTNGDSFDNTYVEPCHGVQWLENLADLRFAYHRITDMPGAHRALAGDIDLDGDLDIIATTYLPPQIKPLSAPPKPLASILCLEQTLPGKFVRHTLETDSPYHAALQVADFDNDGDLDFATGSHSVASTQKLPQQLAVWWNQAVETK